MSTDVPFVYRFHPVGQGLFSTGTLLPRQEGLAPFHWTFDCGSMAKKADWISQVNWYRDLVLQEDTLNILCISHFDKDHVSGLGELLEGRHVDTVVIPYYTPLERLVLGAMQGGRGGQNDTEYNEFLSNPVAFLIEHAASIQQIVVVHRSPPEAPTWPYGGDLRPDSPVFGLKDRPVDTEHRFSGNERTLNREQWHVKVWETQSSQGVPPFSTGLPKSVSKWGGNLLFAGESCHLHAVSPPSRGVLPQWEFLFFHKPESADTISRLSYDLNRILEEAGRLTGHPPSLEEALRDKEIRKRIRDAYHHAFPDSMRFNTAGVCMYSGPLADTLKWAAVSLPRTWHGIPPTLPTREPMRCWTHGTHFPERPERMAVLHIGDANFQPAQHRVELRAFLTADRWQDIHMLQVPHHGSENNWQVGSANEFNHQWSVFPADPQYKHHHPDKAVLLDLLARHPLLVDRIAGIEWSGLCHFGEP